MTRKKNETRAASLALSASNKQSVAHKLLIELLSYQFAFPVRWIETQNAFFDRDQTIQRYVEIGPTRVLANMAKKTVEQQFGARDKSRSIQRKFLSSGDDAKDIFYHYEENESDSQDAADEVHATSKPDAPSATPSTQPSIAATPAAKSPPPSPTNSAPAQQVADMPLSAKDIVLALTAQKLKKPFDQVPVEKSIRELSGGKSTLQNELIGDLGAELGNLPDGSEDLTLAALGESVASTFSGQPGKQISTLISKLISSKMPGGFNQQAIRQYLSSNWGLGPQRQTAVICFSISAEPPSRLANTEAAKEFFDSVVQRYGAFSGIALSAGASNSQTSSAQPTMIDAASLGLATKEYKDTLAKIHDVLSNFLGVDGDAAGEDAVAALEASKERLSEKLEHWNAEFGDEISTGTIPIFDARKERFYDSWWNWVKVDLISFIQDLQLQPGDGHMLPDVESRRQQILNRWTPACAQITKFFSIDSNENLLLKLNLQMLLEIGTSTLNRPPTFKFTNPVKAPKTTIDPSGRIVYTEVLRGSSHNRSNYARVISDGSWDPSTQRNLPFIHLKSRQGQDWKYNRQWTDILMESLVVGVTSGLTFAGKVVLVTGAGPGSIGSEIVRGLLEGGAEVLVTTSRVPSSTAKFYSEMYKSHGSKGSKLIVLPFNQGSKQDCEALINHIYTNKSGYGGDLDIIIPFAAIGDSGQLDNLGSKSELAHRLMLTNLLRLLGYVKQQKAQRNLNSRPTNIILPLSPNHGTFGGDGLYSESKLGLETLFNRFYSEGWSTYLTICGAVIGWTRGTGLMSANNMLAEEVESHNTLTFSQSEMAFNILALAIPAIASICEDEPVYADLSGNLQSVPDLKAILSSARKNFSKQSKIRKALVAENLHEQNLLGAHLATESNKQPPRRRANLQVGYPSLSDYKTTTANVPDLSGMVDLKRTIVVVGFSDLSPWGSSRTRWEMEHKGDLTLEGYIEMAWIMGLIKHFNGEVKGEPFVGWVDSKTKEPVHDDEMKEKYGKTIMENSGIRFIEPKLFDGYDPEKKEFLHEVVVEEDLPPFEVSKATAEAFKLRHGDKASISAIPGSESAEYKVQIKKGAHFMVAKAVPFSRLVAGQLPSGFDPVNYGIPEDIVSQVDPITIYVLCCVCQALLSAGIQDPYEVYKHIHVSELANCIGTGVGGLKAMRGVYRDRYLDRPVQSDILQESYLNVMGAWTNMLLLASAGPIKSPVGTCATAVESMDSGCESILLGKAKMAFVGGTDDFQEEMSYEFANMKATSNTHDELAKGRLPSEMSRPGTTTRSGFMESAGCGIQIIMNAELALEMGLPIYAVLAHTQMAGDRVGRSVPAPGQGVLTAARESVGAADSPLLNLEYRRRNLNETVQAIQMWHTKELLLARQMPGDITKIVKSIEATSECRIRDARNLWGNDFRKQDPEISPMRAALSVWGLTVDDIQVASLHGTSTKANDTNESDVINKQMNKLGRSKGNPVLAISQKYLTGHPKGAAGAWMFNGCLQVLQTGIVPGNRNADNIDESFQQYEHVLYPSHTIQTSGIKAFMLTSFGFGQKGGIVIAIAPNYLFAAITEERFNNYRARVLPRQEKANRTFITGIMTNSIFKAKDHSPWNKEDETKVFLDPLARVSSNTLTNEIAFDGKNLHPVIPAINGSPKAQDAALNEQLNFLNQISKQFLDTNANASTTGVGVDVENISCINFENAIFVERNFTSEERAYAERSPNPQAAFAGRWSAKEAVFKSLGVQSKGAGAAMNDIEVWSDGGVPMIKLHGEVAQIAKAKGISDFKISISHCPDTVMAVAVAVKGQGVEGCGGCAGSKGFSF